MVVSASDYIIIIETINYIKHTQFQNAEKFFRICV